MRQRERLRQKQRKEILQRLRKIIPKFRNASTVEVLSFLRKLFSLPYEV